ncbi:uncharacterized protein METZ01_LOCUS308919, partial [marine metagenome]
VAALVEWPATSPVEGGGCGLEGPVVALVH